MAQQFAVMETMPDGEQVRRASGSAKYCLIVQGQMQGAGCAVEVVPLRTAAQIAEQLARLEDGDAVVIDGVNVHRQDGTRGPRWWVQENMGGVQFARSARAAAAKVVALRNS